MLSLPPSTSGTKLRRVFSVQRRCLSLSQEQVLLHSSSDPKWTKTRKVASSVCKCQALGQMVLLYVWRKTSPTKKGCRKVAEPKTKGTMPMCILTKGKTERPKTMFSVAKDKVKGTIATSTHFITHLTPHRILSISKVGTMSSSCPQQSMQLLANLKQMKK